MAWIVQEAKSSKASYYAIGRLFQSYTLIYALLGVITYPSIPAATLLNDNPETYRGAVKQQVIEGVTAWAAIIFKYTLKQNGGVY